LERRRATTTLRATAPTPPSPATPCSAPSRVVLVHTGGGRVTGSEIDGSAGRRLTAATPLGQRRAVFLSGLAVLRSPRRGYCVALRRWRRPPRKKAEVVLGCVSIPLHRIAFVERQAGEWFGPLPGRRIVIRAATGSTLESVLRAQPGNRLPPWAIGTLLGLLVGHECGRLRTRANGAG
jgi:hypothetical protein